MGDWKKKVVTKWVREHNGSVARIKKEGRMFSWVIIRSDVREEVHYGAADNLQKAQSDAAKWQNQNPMED